MEHLKIQEAVKQHRASSSYCYAADLSLPLSTCIDAAAVELHTDLRFGSLHVTYLCSLYIRDLGHGSKSWIVWINKYRGE